LYGRREITFDLDEGIVDIDTHDEDGRDERGRRRERGEGIYENISMEGQGEHSRMWNGALPNFRAKPISIK